MTNFASRVREVALRLIELLEAHSLPYAMMGGIAVPVWGIPRATYDVKDFADVQNILSVQGLVEEEYIRSWAERLGLERTLDRAIEEADLPGGAGGA